MGPSQCSFSGSSVGALPSWEHKWIALKREAKDWMEVSSLYHPTTFCPHNMHHHQLEKKRPMTAHDPRCNAPYLSTRGWPFLFAPRSGSFDRHAATSRLPQRTTAVSTEEYDRMTDQGVHMNFWDGRPRLLRWAWPGSVARARRRWPPGSYGTPCEKGRGEGEDSTGRGWAFPGSALSFWELGRCQRCLKHGVKIVKIRGMEYGGWLDKLLYVIVARR